MSSYDVSTATRTGPQHYDLSGEPEQNGHAEAPGTSTLELLRAAADEVAAKVEETEKPIVLYSPGAKLIRLTCEPIRTQRQITAAQKAALPKVERGKQVPNFMNMDPTRVHSRLIADQTIEIAILDKSSGQYKPIVNGQGEPLDFTDPHLLSTFGTSEGGAAVRAIFVRDHHLLTAGQQLLDESGWGEPEGDDDDPPALSRRERRGSSG